MSAATALLDPDLDEPTGREPAFDHTEIAARIATAREEHLRALGHQPTCDDPAEARRAEHAHAAECERRQRRAELEAGRLGYAFTLIPPRPFPYLATAAPAPRRSSSPREKPAVTVAAAPTPSTTALPEVPGVKPEKVRAVWDAAHRIAARGEVVTSSAIVDEGGGMLGVVFKVQTALRKAGAWPWPAVRGRPPASPTASQAKPRPTRRPSSPPSVPRVGRSETSAGDSTSDAPKRVLGHSGAVPGDAPQGDPLVLELLKGTLSAALAHLGPHLSHRNRFALEMCLEVLK